MSDGSPSPTPVCPRCVQLEQRIAGLEALVRDLQATVRDLQERLNRNSSNSSIPPSANPLQAPKPVVKPPSGHKPGGQKGHPGHHRHRLPPERVTNIVPYVPTICAQCQAPLPAEPRSDDPEPIWHQVAELPSSLPSLPSIEDVLAPALALVTSIAARFPQRSVPTSAGHAWPR